MSTFTPQHHEFQAETRQLLDIVIHSLYTDREIFVRELVSNAADSLEKLRHRQLAGESVFDEGLDLEINITTDDQKGTFTIQDFGIGFTREELVENLGTIAHSGSKAFVEALKQRRAEGDTSPATELIGQFGVGFYSAFMVADTVTVFTHSVEESGEHLKWTSDGRGGYEVESSEGQRRGAKIVVQLKEDAKEFASADTIKGILRKYSAYVPFPVNINGERLNTQQAIWLRPKDEISEEEYNEFYKYHAHAPDEPIVRLHFASDVPLDLHALLYVPSHNPELMGFGRMEPEVSLYCKRVLIHPNPDKLLPEWLRFLRGVVDSADLPLNISRESMQDSALLRKIGEILTTRFLKQLESMLKKQPEEYDKFYGSFSAFLEEGILHSTEHRERLAKLLRFPSTLTEKGKLTTLAEYVSRMPDSQKAIYYLHLPDQETTDPALEAFQNANREVLLLRTELDEFALANLREFDGKPLRHAAQDGLADEDMGPETGEADPLPKQELEKLLPFIKEHAGIAFADVRASRRLVGSPAIALHNDPHMAPALRRALSRLPGQPMMNMPESLILEVNPRHPVLHHLAKLQTEETPVASLLARQLADNAMLAAGMGEDPRRMAQRVNELLTVLAGGQPNPPAASDEDISSEPQIVEGEVEDTSEGEIKS